MSKELAEKKPQPSYAPVYAAALYPDLSKIAREHGYALAVHGSLQRDFDLIAVPWVENPSEPATVLDAITSEFAIRLITPKDQGNDKPHGRLAYSISIGHGDCALDISFMPVQAAAESRGIAKGRVEERKDCALLAQSFQIAHCKSHHDDAVDNTANAIKEAIMERGSTILSAAAEPFCPDFQIGGVGTVELQEISGNTFEERAVIGVLVTSQPQEIAGEG